ncbi:MAG: hypothetical protein ACPGOV_17110 [Magnetovibrionaceae bacterium]
MPDSSRLGVAISTLHTEFAAHGYVWAETMNGISTYVHRISGKAIQFDEERQPEAMIGYVEKDYADFIRYLMVIKSR